jgi:hypothetical protein
MGNRQTLLGSVIESWELLLMIFKFDVVRPRGYSLLSSDLWCWILRTFNVPSRLSSLWIDAHHRITIVISRSVFSKPQELQESTDVEILPYFEKTKLGRNYEMLYLLPWAFGLITLLSTLFPSNAQVFLRISNNYQQTLLPHKWQQKMLHESKNIPVKTYTNPIVAAIRQFSRDDVWQP